MQTIAAIDVGSNAMRMVVGRFVYGGKVDTIENSHLLNKKKMKHSALNLRVWSSR
jgi:exopolyphosphatase/pppGpp-phosphohydrolase